MIIFVNGYTLGCEPYRPYWSSNKKYPDDYINAAIKYFKDDHVINESFVNGTGKWFASRAQTRRKAGRKFAPFFLESINDKLKAGETLKFVCHSMGSAYAEGMIDYLVKQKVPIEKIVHLGVADAKNIKIPVETRLIKRLQINTTNDIIIDKIANWFYRDEKKIIPHITRFGKVNWDPWHYHKEHMEYIKRKDLKFALDSHFDTKTFGFTFGWVKILEELKLKEEIGNRSSGNKKNPVYEIPRQEFQFESLMIDHKYMTFLEHYKKDNSDKFLFVMNFK